MFRHVIAKSSSIKCIGSRCPAGAVVALASCLLLWAGPVSAHQASISHSTVRISHDQTTIDYRLQLSPPDVAEVVGLEPDAEPTDEAVVQGKDRLFEYMLARITLLSDGAPCPVEPGDARVTQQGGRFVELTWRARCPAAIVQLAIDYQLFFDLDPLHRGLINVYYRGEPAFAELKEGQSRFVWDLETPPPSSLFAFAVSGVEHIVFGFDHIAFLLGLLLVVVIQRMSDQSWQPRGLGPGLRHTALIVTSFTVAHSITLIAATLDLISLDSRLVESVIAASIVYVAIENIIKPDVRYRYLVTFIFGLIHGLGFASMLKVLLPPEDVVGPLLLFNVGVELGQLAIVVVVMPILHLVGRSLGADGYRRGFLPIGSGVLAILGLLWLIERLFEVTILGL